MCHMCVIGSLERRKGTCMRDSLMDDVDNCLSYIMKLNEYVLDTNLCTSHIFFVFNSIIINLFKYMLHVCLILR